MTEARTPILHIIVIRLNADEYSSRLGYSGTAPDSCLEQADWGRSTVVGTYSQVLLQNTAAIITCYVQEPPPTKGQRKRAINIFGKFGNNQFTLALLIAMGVHCHIKFRKPTNGSFVTGGVVSGVVRYSLDEDTVITKITVSLQAKGYLDVHNMRKKEEADGLVKEEEEYLNENIIALDNRNGHFLSIGTYKAKFQFRLPQNIPPTLDFVKTAGTNTVRCRIGYYLRIQFHNPEGNKRFSTIINVIPGINPESLREPRIYDKQRKLIQLLRDSLVTIKATINNPVVSQGGTADLVYEIFNDTNVNFKSVESKLVEVTSLPRGQCDSTFSYEVVTDVKTAGVRSGATQTINVEIPIPKDVNTIENSQLIARDYYVKVTVYLPLPYRNVTLKVPLQISGFIQEQKLNDNEAVASCWEEVNEEDIVNSSEDLS